MGMIRSVKGEGEEGVGGSKKTGRGRIKGWKL